MSYFRLSYAIIFFLFLSACGDTEQELLEAAKGDVLEDTASIDLLNEQVKKRLDYFDEKFSNVNSELVLTPAQREAIAPVIREKLEVMEALQLYTIPNKLVRKAKKDSIRAAWHSLIDTHLTLAQVKVRHSPTINLQRTGD